MGDQEDANFFGPSEDEMRAAAYRAQQQQQADAEDYYSQIINLFEERGKTPVTVASVAVEGLARTRTWVVVPQLQDVFEAHTFEEATTRAEEARLRLHRLGCFKTVDVTLDMVASPLSPVENSSSSSSSSSSSNNSSSSSSSSSSNRNSISNGGDSSKKNDAMTVTYEVEEKRLLSGGTGMTWGKHQGTADLKAMLVNPLGVGDCLTVKAMRATSGPTSYDATYMLPVDGDMDFPLSVHAAKVVREVPTSAQRWLTHTFGASYQTYSLLGSHSMGYSVDWREVGQVQSGSPMALRAEAGHTLKSALKHVLRVDFRDEEGVNGSDIKLTTELAGGRLLGGSAHHIMNDVEWTHCINPAPGWEFKTCVRGGLLLPLSQLFNSSTLTESSSSPAANTLEGATLAPRVVPHRSSICDRFFLGGSLDVRGFNLNGIGPNHGANAALGGDAYWAAAVHAFSPLPYAPWRERVGNTVRMHAFANAGALARFQGEGLRATALALGQRPAAAAGLGVAATIGPAAIEVNWCFTLGAGREDRASPGLNIGIGVSTL